MTSCSRVEQFYNKSVAQRVQLLVKSCSLSPKDTDILLNSIQDSHVSDILDCMSENVVGAWILPFSIATNFIVNNQDCFIPMVTEEPSVVAAASNAAKMARKHGGFSVSNVSSITVGQIQLIDVKEFKRVKELIEDQYHQNLLDLANRVDPILIEKGGGARRICLSLISTNLGEMVDVHLLVDCVNAMGANTINTMLEALAPEIERLSGGRALLRIVSNLAVHRIVTVTAIFDKELLGGDKVVQDILYAVEFANHDMFRAVTHNKGIMNGVDAVVCATGNDTRAVEAGAHAFAAWGHSYRPLSRFHLDELGNLVGVMELPLSVGTVGGATRSLPWARLALHILGTEGAEMVAQCAAAAGLACNVAALRALTTEGIQKGHMKLHLRKKI